MPTSTFDWRSQIQIRATDQEDTNACSAFSVAAVVEVAWRIFHSQDSVKVSPGYLHTCIGHAGETDIGTIDQEPVSLSYLLSELKSGGFAIESNPPTFPFPPAQCQLTKAPRKITGYLQLAAGSDYRTIIQTAPIVAEMLFWNDFVNFHPGAGAVAIYSPDTSQPGPFGHAVCVLGFNQAGWIIKNSFGQNWGDGSGCATIAYGTCGLLDAPAVNGWSGNAFSIQV